MRQALAESKPYPKNNYKNVNSFCGSGAMMEKLFLILIHFQAE